MTWKDEYTKTLQTVKKLGTRLINHQKKTKKKIEKENEIKKKKKKNGKFPVSGSPSWLGPLSRYNALPTELRGTCHEGRANFKIICNKYSMFYKVQVGKDSEEDVF